MIANTLLVTVVIGDEYLERYKALFFQNHKEYASKSGYDLTVVTEFLDTNNQHSCFISLQKILVCSQEFSRRYKYIIYIDADIIFNIKIATPLHLLVDSPKIYIANEYTQPSPVMRLEIQRLNGWERSAAEYYALAGLSIETNAVLNTGVMIFTPELHREMLEEIYIKALGSGFNHPRGFHFEQAMIGYEFQKKSCWEPLPNEWNAIWLLQKIAPNNNLNLLEFYAHNKAVHFAGNCDIHLIPNLLAAYNSL